MALQCLQRAKDLIAKDDEASLKYACLELRFCIEYIIYLYLQTYIQEVPDETIKKWTPKQIINVLCEADPNADKNHKVFIGKQDVQGIPAKTMKYLGEEHRFSLEWANTRHNALGNFLHAPTLSQIENHKLPTKEKILKKANEVVAEVDKILSSQIFNVNFGVFCEFVCTCCNTKIKCRDKSVSQERGIVCPNSKCQAVYNIVSEQNNKVDFKLREEEIMCPSCGKPNFIGSYLVTYGNLFPCAHCGEKSEIQYAIVPLC